ncbi:hypothetical protein V1477_011478 [Vespula maculifrons]|uniref:Uncharacterized protein n=1 Tax=Vespula maculifrons TaxID=7453 RepID=A0ABD2BZY0_VESMC
MILNLSRNRKCPLSRHKPLKNLRKLCLKMIKRYWYKTRIDMYHKINVIIKKNMFMKLMKTMHKIGKIETLVSSQEPIAPSTEATINNRSKASLGKKEISQLWLMVKRKTLLVLDPLDPVLITIIANSYTIGNGNIATSVTMTYDRSQNG